MNDTPLLTPQAAAAAVAAALLSAAAQPPAQAAAWLAGALEQLADPALQDGLLGALRQAAEKHGEVLDALWQAWAETRLPRLEVMLQAFDRPAAQPLRLAVLSSLCLGRALALPPQTGLVEALLAACADRDAQIAAAAQAALQSMSDPAAQEELCRWVLEHDNPYARQAALAGGFAPRRPQERALFYLLTGQWQQYETLDFDARLVEAVYAAGSDSLRQQIASLARQRGWAGFVQAVSGARARRRLGKLSEFEWEAVLVILGREQRWEELWLLAQTAPPRWSARLLRSLAEAGWLPAAPDERSACQQFVQQSAACLQAGEPQAKRLQHQAALYGHSRQITALLHLPEHNLAASASADRSVRLWDLRANRLLKTLPDHADYVLCLAYSPADGWLASGSADKTVRLWNLPDGSPRAVLGGHAGRVSLLALAPGAAGQAVLVSGDEQGVYLWDTHRQHMLQSLRGQFNGLNALGIAPAPDSPLLVTGDNDRSVKLWSLPPPGAPTGAELRRSLLTPIVGWAISADGRLLASTSSYSAVQLWSLPAGETLRSLPGRANNTLLAFSPDGSWLACADRANVLLWDLTGGTQQTLSGGVGLTSALAFSPDSQLLAAGNQDRTVRLWQLARPAAPLSLRPLEGYTTPVKHLVFSPSGERLLSADELSLQLWSVDDLAALLNTPSHQLDLAALARLAQDSDLEQAQRAWLEYSQGLARWARRFDIELHEPGDGSAARPIPIGDFDIEIEF